LKRRKIGAIFSDYDGTLAPDDVPLESSRVPLRIEEPLQRIASSIPIAIVTSKDFDFVRPRTTFASAWACASGLEIVLSDGTAIEHPGKEEEEEQGRLQLQEGLEYVKTLGEDGVTLELKRSTKGKLLGFSVDWRRTRRGSVPPAPSGRFIRDVMVDLAERGLVVLHDSSWPYFDVFGTMPDKGRAIRRLKHLLHVGRNIVYLGDSVVDNSGFKVADVSVCVDHGQDIRSVCSQFSVRYRQLGSFLTSLYAAGLFLDLETMQKRS